MGILGPLGTEREKAVSPLLGGPVGQSRSGRSLEEGGEISCPLIQGTREGGGEAALGRPAVQAERGQ